MSVRVAWIKSNSKAQRFSEVQNRRTYPDTAQMHTPSDCHLRLWLEGHTCYLYTPHTYGPCFDFLPSWRFVLDWCCGCLRSVTFRNCVNTAWLEPGHSWITVVMEMQIRPAWLTLAGAHTNQSCKKQLCLNTWRGKKKQSVWLVVVCHFTLS